MAEAADGVIHHSAYGQRVMQRRYRYRPDAIHVVIPHGHFGALHATAAAVPVRRSRPPSDWSRPRAGSGCSGHPAEKDVLRFLDAAVASGRQDLQVLCYSLRPGEQAPVDPRIVVAEPYETVGADVYAQRLAVCDLVALPFDPEGEMLATGVASDVIGLGLGPW